MQEPHVGTLNIVIEAIIEIQSTEIRAYTLCREYRHIDPKQYRHKSSQTVSTYRVDTKLTTFWIHKLK